MSDHEHPPRAFGPGADADSRSPRQSPVAWPAILDEQPFAEQIEPVLRQRDSHRHRQVPGAATQALIRQRPIDSRPALQRTPSTPAHRVNALERLERANQHRGR